MSQHRTPSEEMLVKLDEHIRVSSTQFEILGERLSEVAKTLETLLEAMQSAVEIEESRPEPQSQGDLLAEAISTLTSEQKQEPDTLFPAWGAPKREK